MPFSGGAFWEEDKGHVALWYRCGGEYATTIDHARSSTTGTCVAYSKDGVHFNKTQQVECVSKHQLVS